MVPPFLPNVHYNKTTPINAGIFYCEILIYFIMLYFYQTRSNVLTMKGGCMSTQIVKFPKRSTFKQIVTEKVNQYFEQEKRSPHATSQQIAKVFVLFLWLILTYVALVFFATTWWQAALLSVSAGLSMAGIGF